MAKRMHVKKNDTVVVISGKDKGKQGKVLESIPEAGRVLVENVNMISRHTKPRSQNDRQSGIIRKEAPVYASNVMLVCGKCNKATRHAHKMSGDKKVRVCKKCGAVLE